MKINIHTFKDIPGLYQRAKDIGLDHIFIAGWNRYGFDNGYPIYTPAIELGGEEILKQSIDEVRSLGGWVTLYINSRICDVEQADNLSRKALTYSKERYGTR